MRTGSGRLIAAGLLTIISLRPAVVHAGVEPLKRAVENVTQGPLDGLLAPVVGTLTGFRNVSAEGHSVAGTIALGSIASLGLSIFDGSAAFFRTLAGLVELPVGVGALAASPFTNWEPAPFFDVEKSPALVQHPSPWFNVKFGVYHLGVTE